MNLKNLLVLLLLNTVNCFTQQNIEITVTDALTHEPLPFATLYLKEVGKGTTTNLEGVAKLYSKLSIDTLVCSYIGYEKNVFPIDLNEGAKISIQLTSSNTKLEEVEIVYKKPLSVNKILKKTLRNTIENYSETAVNFQGLYRELMQENGKFIYINEAVVDLHYTKYIQKNIDLKSVKKFLNDDSYAFEYEQNYFFDGFPTQHNTRDDKVKIIESRSSESSSLNKLDMSITGNPLSLTAKDYIKYRNDFLNPRTLNNYMYSKKESELVNGKSCYVIQFHPKSASKRVIFNHIFKNKNGCYTGRLYVDKKSFAIVKMDFQLLQSFDYGFYKHRIPLNYTVSVEYKEFESKWYLNKVSLQQTRKLYLKNKKASLVNSYQELFIAHINKDSVHEISEKDEWKHTRLTQLRNYESLYNPEFWMNYELGSYPKLSNKIKTDLESKTPLEEQFLSRFKQKKNLLIPTANKEKTVHQYPLESITDYYHWFSNPTKSDLFYNYLEKENEFAENHLIPERKTQKRIFTNLNSFYLKDTTKNIRGHKKGDLYRDNDSLEYLHLYEYLDSINRKSIFNYENFKIKRPNCYFTKIKTSNMNLGIQYTVNGGKNNNLIIQTKSNADILDSISEVYSFEWFNDSLLLYSKCNTTKRSDKLFCRNINTQQDSLLFFISDSTFDVSISKTKNKFICSIQSMNENEIYVADTTQLYPYFELILPRELNVVHEPKEFDNTLHFLTNKDALNNKVAVFENGVLTDLIIVKDDIKITDFLITDKYYVLNTLNNSFNEILFKLKVEKKWHKIEFSSKIFDGVLNLKNNDVINIEYSTPNTPFIHYTFDLNKNTLSKVNQSKIKFKYNQVLNNIAVNRVWVKAYDGSKIPMTVLKSSYVTKSHKGLILKAYGMYGSISGGYDFNKEDITLLNEGYTIVYAHVRGGGVLGSNWHLEGKLLNKKNTFNDYISCAEYLIKKKYTTPDYLVGYGVSAGGLLMGAVINRRPELFNTVILDHAYLGALTTMMMDTLPLTTDHYKEIGNPNEKIYYEYIKSYSPYQNIKRQAYPNLFFIASSNDYQTPTWQIAKYVAKVKEYNIGTSTILFKTHFGSGHIGSTFGDDWMKDLAFKNAFIQMNLFE